MITFDGRLYEPCRITRPKTDIIDKYHSLMYNFQSLKFDEYQKLCCKCHIILFQW